MENNNVDALKPKSYIIMYDMNALPLLFVWGGAYYCSSLPDMEVIYPHSMEYGGESKDCYECLHQISLFTMGLGTIPSHVYIKSDIPSIAAYSLSKFILNGILFYISTSAEGNTFLDFYIGVSLASAFYLVEMIDKGVRIHRHNEKLNKSAKKDGLSISPYAWSDRFGLAMQIKF